jgi:hypothetical protein
MTEGPVKLLGKLPSDKSGMNGLEMASGAMVDAPHRSFLVVAVVSNGKTETDHADGDAQTPHALISQIEVALDPENITALRGVLDRLQDKRNGRNRLPID